jgi:hypothetical protein
MVLPAVRLFSFVRAAFAVSFLAVLVACGGGTPSKPPELPKVPELTAERIEADPWILFPSGAIIVSTLDARAFYAEKTLGPQVAQLAEQYAPIGAEVGFSPSRDLDRVNVASYSLAGYDVLAVLVGRFDAAKIDALAKSKGATKGGGLLVESTYAGRTVYTNSNVGFTVLTPKVVLAGTETAIRRALDRIKDGRAQRDLFPWMLDTMATPGAAIAAAGDFKNQPLGAMAVQGVRIPATEGLVAFRALGTFQEPGLQIAGSVTYDTDAHAQAGQAGIKQLVLMYNGYAGLSQQLPILRDVNTTIDKTDVQVKLAVDDQSLRTFLGKVPQLFPPPR